VESVLAQQADVEIIPVCDGPDALEAVIAQEAAARDGRVRPPRWSSPVLGLSAARNTGTAAASGDYLLYLDGDDTLVPGALDAIDERLTHIGEVDVLYLGHERTHWWRGPRPGDAAGELLTRAPAHAFAPHEAPWLTGTALPAWSAAHRRRFVMGHDLRFPPGHYTDNAWGGLALQAARRVAVLDRPCVRHLIRRQGNALHRPGEHQFDLLDQVDLVLSGARRHGVGHERLTELFLELMNKPTIRVVPKPS
jgi:glycosyltransferase involved in cell wall biosynthesis